MDENNIKNEPKKSGCLKKVIYGLGFVALTYVGANWYLNKQKENNQTQTLTEVSSIGIEKRFYSLDREDRAMFVSSLINNDSIDISYIIHNLDKDKCANFLDYIGNSNKLNEEQKTDYVINMYKNLERKNKFEVVKEITKNSIGF